MRRTLAVMVLYFAILALLNGQSVSVGKPTGAIVYATYAPKPDYPYVAKDYRSEGSGAFQLHIQADGTVLSVETARSTGFRELDAAAIRCFLRWRFRPPGRPTKVEIPITFTTHWPGPFPTPSGSSHGRGIQGIPHSTPH